MSYKETVDWLFKQLPNYQLQGATAYKPGLNTIKELLNQIGNPEKKLKFIHVAGTNGKGSVSHMLASIFFENGYKVGLFTSPHLHDFRERIKINGELVSENFVVDFVNRYKEGWKNLEPSFFEITTAMAFDAFKQNECEVCIIETGLGGRLDSTNVIVPEISVITNIGLDHTAFLGDTLEKIAFEKAGIIKENIPVVIGETIPETKIVFENAANFRNAELIFATPLAKIEMDLSGAFQQKNAATVFAVAIKMRKLGWNLFPNKILEGFKNVVANTKFQGRFQTLSHSPRVIVDGAHNVDGVKAFMTEIFQLQFQNLHLVYSAANDKEVEKIFELFPIDANYYFTEFDSKRSIKINELKKLSGKKNLNAEFFEKSHDAFSQAKSKAQTSDLICVFGSFYLIQEIL